jgi:hypothetical protein
MKCSMLCGAALAVLAFGTVSANAGLLYSFEATDATGPTDGFTSNGIAPVPSAIGATDGVGSLHLIAPSGFNGAITTTDLPADLANPALSAITMDTTLTAQSGGTFSSIGFDFFISNNGLNIFGQQWGPATSAWPTSYFAGQLLGLSIPVVGNGTNALNSTSFSDLVAAGWYVSGFQILVSNNGTTSEFVDNIQGVVPEPASLGIIGVAGALALGRRRRA